MSRNSWDIETTGMEELAKALEKIGKDAEKIASKALYKGAGIAADSLTKGIRNIKTEPFKYAKDGKRRLASPEEKAMLEKGRKGITKFQKDGISVQTSIGFQKSGYEKITWNHAKSGKRTKYKTVSGESVKPVAVIANSINHGTSFMVKQPFIRKAENEKKALSVIENEIQSELEKMDIS